MKNTLKELIIFTIILLLLLYSFNEIPYITNQIISTSILWLKKIIPSLFPTLIIIDLIYESNLPYYINKYLHINYIYIISIISGSPSNAYILNNYKTDTTKLLATTKYTSLIFTYTFLKKIFSLNIVIYLIITNIISNIIIIFLIKPSNLNIEKKNNIFLNKIPNSINKSINTLISIYGSIIFFNILPISKIKNIFIKSFLLSITEISSSLNNLSIISLPFNQKLFLTIITISTCGVCIETQIKSIISDTFINYKKYIKYRLIHLMLYLILNLPLLFY